MKYFKRVVVDPPLVIMLLYKYQSRLLHTTQIGISFHSAESKWNCVHSATSKAMLRTRPCKLFPNFSILFYSFILKKLSYSPQTSDFPL